jgi:hypothetical protein
LAIAAASLEPLTPEGSGVGDWIWRASWSICNFWSILVIVAVKFWLISVLRRRGNAINGSSGIVCDLSCAAFGVVLGVFDLDECCESLSLSGEYTCSRAVKIGILVQVLL